MSSINTRCQQCECIFFVYFSSILNEYSLELSCVDLFYFKDISYIINNQVSAKLQEGPQASVQVNNKEFEFFLYYSGFIESLLDISLDIIYSHTEILVWMNHGFTVVR